MNGSSLRVLTYHRVIDRTAAAAANPFLISAPPAVFDRQMRYLARHYRVVSADEVLSALRGGRPLPKRAVLLTFDDGYRDFGEVAWPILRRYRLPAMLFVPTAYPDQPERGFWWDRLACAIARTHRGTLDGTPLGRLPLGSHEARRSALRQVQEHLKSIPHGEAMRRVDAICRELGRRGAGPGSVLSWNELRELATEGVTVAAHTRTHPALTRVPIEQARAEIRGSREDLARELGGVPPVFAYPFGACDDRIMEVVDQEGFEMAFSCLDGHNAVPSPDPLRLRRTNITTRTSPFVFRLRLLTLVSYVDQWRHRPRRPRRPS